MKQWLKKGIFGYNERQEYVCLPRQTIGLFKLVADGIDITGRHLFLGYKPVIFCVEQHHHACQELLISFLFEGKAYGQILLKKAELGKVNFYSAFFARHRMLSRFHQGMWRLKEQVKRRPKGNIGMKGNEYKQLRLAYSCPREINLISLRQGNQHNLFPTDLHGELGGSYFISLRIGGKACEQVERLRQLTLCKWRWRPTKPLIP